MGDMELCFIHACKKTGRHLELLWKDGSFVCPATREAFTFYCLGVIDGRKGL